jgi:hypothetical protein
MPQVRFEPTIPVFDRAATVLSACIPTQDIVTQEHAQICKVSLLSWQSRYGFLKKLSVHM